MRTKFLSSLIGKSWVANAAGPDAYDCWHLARHIEHELFGCDLPDVKFPSHPSWSWMIAAIDSHPERVNWAEVRADAMGLVMARDGALVLMARLDRPAHIGVWLSAERGIMHADQGGGVMLESVSTLKAKGWAKLRFLEHRGEAARAAS